MLSLVYKALNVREKEKGRVALMLGHGFFMGIFFATYVGTAETLFLNILGDNYINQGIFAAGVLGVFTTGVFVFLQNRISYSKLTIFNLISIFLITCSFYILLSSIDPEQNRQYYNLTVFAIFAMNGPVIAVFLLGFWGVFGRMFDLRESKRIIGGIDTGQVLAAIIAFFIMGLMSESIKNIEVYLIVSAFSVLGSLFFLILIIRKFDMEVVKIRDIQQESTRFRSLIKDKYVVLLSLFLALSVTAYLIVERTYLTVLNSQYSDQPEQLLRFIVWFNGSILILSFIFQTFFNDRIIAVYGLKTSLLILPVVLSLFVVGTIIIGTLTGIDPAGSNFYIFFLSVALSKLFITFLRDSMENPAYKLFFMPLDHTVRFDIQTKVEGVVNEFTKMLAGGLILGVGLFAIFNLISYYYILALVIVTWMYVTGKLYNEYRNKIKIKLESKESGKADTYDSLANEIFSKLENGLDKSRPDKAIFSYRLMEKLNPAEAGSGINLMMQNPNEDVREYAQLKMNEIRGVSVSDQYVICVKSAKDSIGKQLVKREELIALFKTGDISNRRIARLSRSTKNDDRQYAAELIGNSKDPDVLSYLIELLKDIEPKVRIAAFNSAEKRYNHEVLNALITNLSHPRYSSLATNAILIIGQNSFEALDAAFYKTGQDYQIMLKVIQVIGKIGGSKARQLLWNKIDYPDKVLASMVLKALGECGFSADLNQITRIKYAIEEDVEDITWNIAAYHEVPNTVEGKILKEAIHEENMHDIDHIYMLLSMLYDSRSINLVKENIESKTSEGITYAIELLDVFLSEELKQKVIPILDDISDSEKIKKLEIFYPRAQLSSKDVLKLLINRDFTQTNRWSKACAIYVIGKSRIQEFIYDLIANLFNPDKIIREIAAWALHEINPDNYHEHTQRLDEITRKELDLVILPRKDGANQWYRSLRYIKILFLKKMNMFGNVSGLTLSMLIDDMEEVKINKDDTFLISGQNGQSFYTLYKGKINYFRGGEIVSTFEESDFIGELYDEGDTIDSGAFFGTNTFAGQEDSVLWKIDKDRFYSLLSDNIEFARLVIEQLKVA